MRGRLAAGAALIGWAGAAGAQQIPWDWQLTPPYDLGRNAAVIELDPGDHSAEELAALKARGSFLICYVSIGTLEDWQDDRDQFPGAVVGNVYEDWEGEAFLDIRRQDVLIPLMTARFQRCKEKGFDAIGADNQDVYINESGFDIGAADQVSYIRAIAQVAHGMGLRIGQKNVGDLTADLIDVLDFAMTEDCFVRDECGAVLPYLAQGKPVYAAEYTDTGVDFGAACDFGAQTGIHFILKDRDLTEFVGTCN